MHVASPFMNTAGVKQRPAGLLDRAGDQRVRESVPALTYTARKAKEHLALWLAGVAWPHSDCLGMAQQHFQARSSNAGWPS